MRNRTGFRSEFYETVLGLKIRFVETGYFSNKLVGLIGRGVKFPPQLGQISLKIEVAQSAQKVHSKVQIIASVASFGKSLPHCSQHGLISSISFLL